MVPEWKGEGNLLELGKLMLGSLADNIVTSFLYLIAFLVMNMST